MSDKSHKHLSIRTNKNLAVRETEVQTKVFEEATVVHSLLKKKHSDVVRSVKRCRKLFTTKSGLTILKVHIFFSFNHVGEGSHESR